MYLPSERGPIARVRVECIRSLTSYIPLTRGFLSSFPDRCRGFTHADCYWRQVRIWTAAAVNSWDASQHTRSGGNLTVPLSSGGGSTAQEHEIGTQCPDGGPRHRYGRVCERQPPLRH